MKRISYINIGYYTKLFNRNFTFDQNISIQIKDKLNSNNLVKNKTIYFIDFENVKFSPSQSIDTNEKVKKSSLYFAFKDLIENTDNCLYVFINCDKYTGQYILTKDFLKTENIFVLSKDDTFFIDTNTISEVESLIANSKYVEEQLNLDNNFINKESIDLIQLKESLISYSIKMYLTNEEYNCIVPTTKENHILQSTSVHVNKYINIKPLIERNTIFSEISYLLSEKIRKKMNIPDFLIASSKNSFALASGVSFFLNSDIIIINQVSPITSYNNFSTLDKIEPNGRYAIIEDFLCMGTEAKLVKGILWSRGVNIDQNVYVFPVASTKLLDNDGASMKKLKIFPLYKLDVDIEYKISTYNTCPICN